MPDHQANHCLSTNCGGGNGATHAVQGSFPDGVVVPVSTVSSSSQSSLAPPVTAGRRLTHAAVLERTVMNKSFVYPARSHNSINSRNLIHPANSSKNCLRAAKESDGIRHGAKGPQREALKSVMQCAHQALATSPTCIVTRQGPNGKATAVISSAWILSLTSSTTVDLRQTNLVKPP